jgi:putative nucleotidyltransferase with HDIG domain
MRMRRWSRRKNDLRSALRRQVPKVHGWLFAVVAALALMGLAAFRMDLSKPPWVEWAGPWQELLGSALVIALLVLLWAAYLRLCHADVIAKARMRVFLVGVVVTVALLGRITDLLAPYLVPEQIGPYLIPVAFGAGLATIFLNAQAGFALTILLSFWVGLGNALDPVAAMLAAFGSGSIAVLRCARLRKFSDLPLTGVEIGIVGILLHGGAALVYHEGAMPNGVALLWSGLNGLMSVLLIFGGLPLAEYVTQKTSPLGLMELLNPSHPLLVLLRERALGTYHHSFSVADLAENAAQATGADPLLAKVGGYYHDIGKIKRPQFFAENQQNGHNPHDEISPSMSKVILSSHIKEGVELAREYGLREDIIHFIRQHHGTSVIRYFYLKALREGKASTESMDDYRYAAELPQTREAAIVMLADGVEAASRAAKDAAHLEQLVTDAMKGPLQDGQLQESPLTLRDLERIKQAFLETLRAMRHDRVRSYPQDSELRGTTR